MNIKYPFKLTPAEEGGFLIQFIDLPEAYSEADTEDEAFYMATDVLNLSLECRLENNEPIPEASDIDTKYKVIPSANIQSALSIRNAKDATRMSTADLARAMGVTWPVADKLTNPKHYPSLRQLEKAANALGRRLVISLV